MSSRSQTETTRYEIVIDARLGARTARLFDGFELAELPDGRTIVVGTVADQAALHGLLNRIRDLGLPLVSVRPAPEHAPLPTREGGLR